MVLLAVSRDLSTGERGYKGDAADDVEQEDEEFSEDFSL